MGLFVAGMIWSISGLGITHIDATALLWTTILSGLSVAVNAFELQLCAAVARARLAFKSAAAYSCWATVANVLPIPASIMIRGAALRGVGASWRETGGVIVAAGMMWMTMAMVVSGYTLLPHWSGFGIIGASGFVTIGISGWIWTKSNGYIAAGFVLVRIVLLALLILRLWLIFQAVDMAIPLDKVSAFALAGIIGNSVAIVPAGIGVTELFGALIATAIEQSPQAAFLVLAINRLLGLTLSGIVAIALGAGAKISLEKVAA